MIKFEFEKPWVTPDGSVKVSLNGDNISQKQLPIRFNVYNRSNITVWSTDLYPNMFSLYYEIPYKRIDIITADGNSLLKWNWNTF